MLVINLISHINYSGARLVKLQSALKQLQSVLNSQQFKDAVLNYTTDGKPTFSFKKNLFHSFEIYTNKQVFEMIQQAHEVPGNVTDGSVDLYLELLNGGGGSTVGYGNPGNETIYTYSEWFDAQTEASIADHIAHEWTHKIGFDHAKYAWQDKNRDRSVPYGIGELVRGFCGLP